MKATFFSLATLAVSAFAAPAPQDLDHDHGKVIGGLNPPAGAVPTGLPSAPPAPEAPENPAGGLGLPGLNDPKARQLPDAPADLGGVDGLVELLTGLVEGIQGKFGNIKDITGQVEAGDSTPEEAEPKVLDNLSSIELNLKEIVTQLTDQAGIPVADGDVQRVLTVVQTLLDVLLKNVNGLVTILGLRPQLVSILHSVFTLLANLLTLVTGLVAGLVPGLVAALSPLLAGLGNGLLAPLLTPVAALLASLSGP